MTFEYECNNCRKELELEMPLAMRDQARCPICHFTLVRRVPPSRVATYVSPNFYTEDRQIMPRDVAEQAIWAKDAQPHPERHSSK